MALGSVGLKTHIWNNNFASILLLLGYPLLLLVLIWMFFAGMALLETSQHVNHAVKGNFSWDYIISTGWRGLEQFWHIAFIAAAAWFGISFLFHQNMIDAATGAHTVSRREEPRLYNLLENLCIARGIAMPKLCIIETEAMNAYASGISAKSYAITVTRGLMNALNDRELEAVLGHELSHILHRDVRLLVVSIVFVGMISFLAEITYRMLVHSVRVSRFRGNRRSGSPLLIMLVAVVVLFIGYMFSLLIRFALSRRREYMADAGAVELTKNPDAMASALRKIAGHDAIPDVPDDVKQMFIENSAAFMGVFATHPPIEKRIAVLEGLAGARVTPAPQQAGGPWG